MNNLWIALSIYGALALAMAGGLWLYLNVRGELKKMRREVEGCSHQVEVWALRMEDELKPVLRNPIQRLNYGRRTEILRLDRQGEPASTIAAALNLPLIEVELTLKLHRLQQAASA